MSVGLVPHLLQVPKLATFTVQFDWFSAPFITALGAIKTLTHFTIIPENTDSMRIDPDFKLQEIHDTVVLPVETPYPALEWFLMQVPPHYDGSLLNRLGRHLTRIELIIPVCEAGINEAKCTHPSHEGLLIEISRIPSLKSITLKYRFTGSFGWTEDPYVGSKTKLDFNSMKHLASLSALEELLVTHPVPILLSDADLRKLSSSWPRMKILSLQDQQFPSCPIQRSLSVLPALLRNMPFLEELSIGVNDALPAGAFILQMFSRIESKIKKIDLLYSFSNTAKSRADSDDFIEVLIFFGVVKFATEDLTFRDDNPVMPIMRAVTKEAWTGLQQKLIRSITTAKEELIHDPRFEGS